MRKVTFPWWELEGTREELNYLKKRMDELTVREAYLMEGACMLEETKTVADVINLTEQLGCFDFFPKVKDVETLGQYIAIHRLEASNKQMPYLDFAKLGQERQKEYSGAFVPGGYVEQNYTCREIYTGSNLSQLKAGYWSVRIKVASRSCPEGVWVMLPDNGTHTDEPDELAVAMDALNISSWRQGMLLDAKCSLSAVQNLVEQYDDLEMLMHHGNGLGYLMEERNQGERHYMGHLNAAIALEGCTRLDQALDVAQNLHCYTFIPSDEHLEEYGNKLAKQRSFIKPGSKLGQCFDYVAYARAEIKRLDLQPCAYGYIARNSNEPLYEYATSAGQTMQL